MNHSTTSSSTAKEHPSTGFTVDNHGPDHHAHFPEGQEANNLEPAEHQVGPEVHGGPPGGAGGKPKLEKFAYSCKSPNPLTLVQWLM